MSLKGTQTENNLLTAFAGKNQTQKRYASFAAKARKEGFIQIAEIFAETAAQEKAHAKRFFKFLEGSGVEENFAAAGLHYGQTKMYPSFASIAEEEGFTNVAAGFRSIMYSDL